jgi:hypothetical protein
MNAAALFAELAAAGVHVSRDGDSLRVRGGRDGSIAPFLETIRHHKPALLLELLQTEIVAAASIDPAHFDRQHYDELWRRWRALNQENTR